jgi:DNA-binding transcriptional MerR regulator
MMSQPQQHYYSTAQVARLACVTARQLQWWDEQGILTPAQSDHRRLYEPRQAFAALLFRELRARGFSLSRVKQVWKAAQKQGFALPDETRRWLLTDGVRVVFLAHPDVVLAFLEQRRSPAFTLIPLEQLAARMSEQSARCTLRRGPGMAREMERERGEARMVREA